MEPVRAIQLWNTVCSESLGVDSEGNEITKLTPFGLAMYGAGLNIYLPIPVYPSNVEDLKKVSEFLLNWGATILEVANLEK